MLQHEQRIYFFIKITLRFVGILFLTHTDSGLVTHSQLTALWGERGETGSPDVSGAVTWPDES